MLSINNLSKLEREFFEKGYSIIAKHKNLNKSNDINLSSYVPNINNNGECMVYISSSSCNSIQTIVR